jgi:hypothetical protein
MSIATTDALSTEQGFLGEATPGIPPSPEEALPETGELAEQFAEDVPPVLAGEGDEPSSEDPQYVEIRTQVEGELRAAIAAEVAEAHTKQINDLQSIRRSEVAKSEQFLRAKIAGEDQLRREFASILQEYGIEPEQLSQRLELADARVRQRESAALSEQQQEVASHQQIADVVAQRFQQRQDDAKARGEIPLDPSDPEVGQWRGWFTQVNQQYFSGAMRAMENAKRGLPISAQDFHAREEWDKSIRLMNDFETRHRTTLAERQKNATDVADAQRQAKIKAKQDGRGPQHIATGGGAGPMTDQQLISLAWEKHPDDEGARIRFLRESAPAPSQRRR